ncbi:MAG: AAA family ATPase [Candidatus Bilamarchaeaceae archaeon]
MANGTDMTQYKKAPNRVIYTMIPEAVRTILADRLKEQLQVEQIYIPRGNEVAQIEAAWRAGLVVALLGGAGLGKTTLVMSIANKNKIPLTTVSGNEETKTYQLIGYPMESDGILLYKDGPVSLPIRAQTKAMLYIDEAVEMPQNVFSTLSGLLDHRRELPISDTYENLDARMVQIILAFNPPGVDRMDRLFKPATLDRMVGIVFDNPNGADALRILKMKYGLEAYSAKPAGLRAEMDITIATRKYGDKLAMVYDDLNNTTAKGYDDIVIKDLITPRSLDNALKLIAAGLSPREAAMMAMVNLMAPVDDARAVQFMIAAKATVDSKLPA